MSHSWKDLQFFIIRLLVYLLIAKVVLVTFLSYRDYFPPNFQSDFLVGRESHFYGAYSRAFYAHIVSGPCSLLLGMLLLNNRLRSRYPAWHRRLGRVQGICVLLFVAPSGLWMSAYAHSGGIAGVGFAMLSLATALCVAIGWRKAVQRRYAEHRQWMTRCFLLLCAAVVLRVIGGLASVIQYDAPWVYALAAWVSWLGPLAVYESILLRRRTRHLS